MEFMESMITTIKIDSDEKWIRRDKAIFKDVIHKGTTCELCKMSPIVGIWYKSATKRNYDICIDCEAREGQNDVFLKIKKPEDFDKYLEDLKKAVEGNLEEEKKEAPIEEKSAFDDIEPPEFIFEK